MRSMFVTVLIAPVLLLQNEVESAVVVCPRVWPVTSPEGLCHVVNGDSEFSFSQGDDILVRKACFSHSLGEGREEEGAAPRLTEGLEEGVVFDSEVLEEYFPPI